MKFLNFVFLIHFYMIYYCINRELEPQNVILQNLLKFLNTGYNPNITMILNNKYYFNIFYIQPVLTNEHYAIYNDSINIREPKLIFYINFKLYTSLNSKVKYYNLNEEIDNDIPVIALMELNLNSLIFDRLEDNSYILKNNFKNENFLDNSNLIFNL